ncbi:MAG: AbrB/MazE/SpoVT family DNA-binding domain-containing protein [Acetobacteraceae bacterium]
MPSDDALTTVLSTKGQVILPKAVRDRLHWSAGTRLAVESTAEGVLLKPVRAFPPSRIEDVFGCLKYDGPPKTIEEMDTAVTEEVMRRYACCRY